MVISLATKVSEIKISIVDTAGSAPTNTKLKNILKTGNKIRSITSISKKKLTTEIEKKQKIRDCSKQKNKIKKNTNFSLKQYVFLKVLNTKSDE